MNKLFTKIAAFCLGATMAIGVGVAIASNSEAIPVHATVGSDVTIGSGTYTSLYETGFESATASTTYNSTQTYGTSATNGTSWSVYYGTVSTNATLTGSKSMQMRWYSTAKTNYPHAETTSAVENVQAFKFNYAVGNTNVHFKVQYGTNGSSWTDIATISPSGTTKTEYNHEFTSAISSFYFRVLVEGNAPSSGNYNFRIDDIVFGSPKAVTCTVTLNKNGGSGGTDSVSATKGSAMPTLASAPTRTGYTFAGYYDDASAGTQYYKADKTSARNWDKDGTTATLYAHWTANQYNINYYDQGGSAFSGSHESGYPTKHTYGTETTLKGATKGGYNFDGWFTTSACTGSAVTSLGATSYTDAISLYAKWTATGTTYSITTTVTNGTYSGDTTITDNGGVASVTIAPTGDYKLPASVSVSGADHTYNDSTGVIALSNATGNVTISAAMVALTEYSITVNETNGSHTGASTIKESRTASLTFEPDSGYGQPASVAVTGATYTWTRGTGVLSLSNPTGNVAVTYVAAENELTSITLGTKKTAYILGEEFSMPVVTAHYSVAADKVVTTSAKQSGYDPYSLGNQSITISYTEGGITKTSSYSVTVSAKSVVTTVTWNKVTSTADIAVGDVIIIADNSQAVALSTEQRSNNRGVAAITKANNQITWSDQLTNEPQQLTLRSTSSIEGAPSGSFGLDTGDGFLYTPSSNSNYLRTQTTNNINGAFVITVTSGTAVISATESSNRPLMRSNYTNSPSIFSCYAANSTTGNGLEIYKRVETQTGTADLIRITATYSGGEKYVGDPISASDFTVKKQLNTGDELIDVASGYTLSANTLSSTSNTITVSYTENNITKTADVVVPATERSATVTSVTLIQGVGVVKDYIDWSGTAWDYTGLTVQCVWSDSSFNEEFSLADLVSSGDATVSPAKPAVGVTSFTVTYSYYGTTMTSNTVSGITVVADYVTSMSWGNTTGAHFKHFSGETLTEDVVNTWHVKATWAGAGEGSRLYWGDYDLYIGTKKITSLPYTWLSEDDGKALSIHYAQDVDGKEFVKTNNTAVGNICTTINAIDHTESGTGPVEKSVTWTKDDSIAAYGTTSLCDDGVALDANIFMQGAKGDAGTEIRFWSDGIRTYTGGNTLTFIPSNGAVITKITLPTVSAETSSSASESSPYTITGGGSAVTFDIGSKSTIGTDIVVEYTITESTTTTTHYANDMNHFDAQKAVVEFSNYLNSQMNAANVCSGTHENLSTAWANVADKYDELFGSGESALKGTELAWAKNMLKYADAKWGSDAEAACVEKAMKTYDHCVTQYSGTCTAFMSDVRSVNPAVFNPLTSIKSSGNTIAIITVISLISVSAVGGYFFLRKRKED